MYALKGYAKNNPGVLSKFSLKVFGGGRQEWLNLIVNNNSPLGPAWKQAALQMVQSGVLAQIDYTWLGELKSTSVLEDSLMVLKPTQLVLVFLVVSFTLCGVVVILLLEKTWHQLMKEKEVNTVVNTDILGNLRSNVDNLMS